MSESELTNSERNLRPGGYVAIILLMGVVGLGAWLIGSYPGESSQWAAPDDCETIAQPITQSYSAGNPSHAPSTVKDHKPTPQNSARDQPESGVNAERQIVEYNCQLAIYTRDLAFFTKWLVYATSGLIVIGLLQGYFLQKSVKVADRATTEARDAIFAAKVSADAAMLHAKAAINAEKPFVYATDVTLVKVPKGRLVDGKETNETAYSMRVKFTNFGRSPAFVTDIGTGEARVRRPPPIPEYRNMGYTGLIIQPLGGTHTHTPYALVVVKPEDDPVSRRNEIAQWIWGRIRYRDFMGGETENGFIGVYEFRDFAGIQNGEAVFEPQFHFGINREGAEAYHYERHKLPEPDRA